MVTVVHHQTYNTKNEDIAGVHRAAQTNTETRDRLKRRARTPRSKMLRTYLHLSPNVARRRQPAPMRAMRFDDNTTKRIPHGLRSARAGRQAGRPDTRAWGPTRTGALLHQTVFNRFPNLEPVAHGEEVTPSPSENQRKTLQFKLDAKKDYYLRLDRSLTMQYSTAIHPGKGLKALHTVPHLTCTRVARSGKTPYCTIPPGFERSPHLHSHKHWNKRQHCVKTSQNCCRKPPCQAQTTVWWYQSKQRAFIYNRQSENWRPTRMV